MDIPCQPVDAAIENPATAADCIYVSSAVFTGSEEAPARKAVAVRGDRICWVGSPEALPAGLRGEETPVEDWGDALIMRWI